MNASAGGAAYSACARSGLADIRRLADVAAGEPGDDGRVEIVIPSTPSSPRRPAPGGFRSRIFAGSRGRRGVPLYRRPGLLRALYEVTRASASGSPADP